MLSRTWLAIPFAALTLTAAAPRARACSPQPPGVYGTVPQNGEKYPGNAAVILQGHDILPTEATVTVDGQPATLKDVSKTLFSEIGLVGVVVEPTPAAGQNVVITGTFCEPVVGCNPMTLYYQATAPDTTPPPAISLTSFNIYDYPDFKSSGGDCQSNSDFAWWLHLDSPIPVQGTDGAVFYSVEGYRDASLAGGPVFTVVGYVDAVWSSTVTIQSTIDTLQGKALPEAACFRVKAYDSAGNTPSISSELLCKPCNYRVDTVAGTGSVHHEPTWTAADVYPGGTCDSSMTGTSTGSASTSASTGTGAGGGSDGGDEVIGGCGCSVAGESDSAAGLFGALALALCSSLRLARRRR
jgi:MYXO-CTERM domain-containing protein